MMSNKTKEALEKARIDVGRWEEANRLGEIVRVQTGLCCQALADLKWNFYKELTQGSDQSKQEEGHGG